MQIEEAQANYQVVENLSEALQPIQLDGPKSKLLRFAGNELELLKPVHNEIDESHFLEQEQVYSEPVQT